jgi:CheY-like chemotaxis protein
MNTAWLPALGLALVLVVGVLLLLLRRGRRAAPPVRPQQPLPPVARGPAPTVPAPLAAPPAPVGLHPAGGNPVGTAAEIDARRQASTEALRQARQRMAEDAARLEARRAAQVQVQAPAPTEPAPRIHPRPVPAPPPPAAARAPLGWASRPMDLGPAEPPAPRPVPKPAALSAQVPAQVPVPVPAPVLAPALAPAPAAAQPVRPLAPVQPLVPTPPQPPQRLATPRVPVVLVADDSKVVRVKTGRLLEKQGWQVLLADDGAAALALLEQHTPDLLITDVEMPGVDGFALTRQVRGHARCARLPVIMITSSDERHRADAQAAGVDLLLGKPYAEETLLAQAQRLLRVNAPVLH